MKLSENELAHYKKTLKKALNLLDKKLSIILHGASFPSLNEYDTGIGSPNSEGAKNFINFIDEIFTSIQLGPSGKTKLVDASPYTGTIFSDNTLFIDLHPLTQKQWNCILSEETLNNIIKNNPNKNINKVAYTYIFNKQEEALKEAFGNFIKNPSKGYEKYKKDNAFWLEKDSLYEALSVKHNNDYWPSWDDEVDKTLLYPKNKEEEDVRNERIKEIKKEFSEVIEFYSFCQFVANEQKEEIKEYAKKHNIKMIADRQVGFSDRDYWADQKLFMQGWSMGCPPDLFSKTGQAWGFPVLQPEKIFKEDGTLGEAGTLLKNIFKKIFKENPGGVRIDHIIGLVDPWVYENGKSPMVKSGAGRLYSSPHHEFLKKYSRISMENMNPEFVHKGEYDNEHIISNLNDEQVKKYAEFLEKIVIKAANEEGLSKEDIICEDLGTLTYPVKRVMEYLNLSGVRVTQFVEVDKPDNIYRGINVDPQHVILAGSHDNEPLAIWAKNLHKSKDYHQHLNLLTDDLVPNENEKNDFRHYMYSDYKNIVKAKFIELFASRAKNVQVFFSDLFGIDEVYNKPGTSGDKNWALRLPNNYEEFYFNQLKNNNGLNLPEILIGTFKTKSEEFCNKNKELINELQELSDKFKA